MLKIKITWLVLVLGLVIIAVIVIPVPSQTSSVREYWIKAEEILWDYAPSYPVNRMTGEPFNEDQLIFVESTPERIGRIYQKAVYRSYTPNFQAVIDGPNEVSDPATGARNIIRQPNSATEHLGLLGPIIRAEVGDRILVHFKNETSFEVSMHPHGFFYTKENEGSPYQDGSSTREKEDDAIPPGGTYDYTWLVPERAGPGPEDPNSIIWPYHSHTDEVRDTNAGLVGAIIVHRKGTLERKTNLPKGIDRELVNLFTVFDENNSLYLDKNIKQFTNTAIEPEDEDFMESNLMHGINGLLYSDLQGLNMKQGEKVRWYLFSTGTEVDLHTPHWHGATLLSRGHRVDVTDIFPASVETLDMTADAPGVWMYHCHVNDHLDAGMTTVFVVEPV